MFRVETMLIAALLGSPVAALWLRGDFTDADVWWRFGLCWLVAWGAVTLLGAAARPLIGNGESPQPEDGPDEHTTTRDDERPGEAETAVGPVPAP